ncbi:MAG: DUF3095 domain-containing protein [Symploca sp. SIO2C1]|nr:DUF3095 domain-containing protein [Symploca sp. SIO2C1]
MYTDEFYSKLPSYDSFCRVVTSNNSFVSIPKDWYIIITDIVGSTKAIEAGRYKDVNLLGACSIIGVLNIAGNLEIPFIFGGDGASILIPPTLCSPAQQALLGTQKLAQEEFGLQLRVGMVPVAVVTAHDYDVKVAKFNVSDKYQQALFTGGGLTYAEQLIKDPLTSKTYELKNLGLCPKVDFSGLKCPWQDIPSPRDEVVSLIVVANSGLNEDNNHIYEGVFKQIDQYYGQQQNFHPVTPQNLNLAFSGKDLSKVANIQSRSKNYLKRKLALLSNQLQNLIALLLIKFKLKIGKLDGKLIKLQIVADTDHLKFDDTLRMVISGNASQREKLTCYLEENYRKGRLVYGLHVSDRVLMTCLVSEQNGRNHIAFVDGADGGYALAAKAMKRRRKLLQNQAIYP